MSDERDDVRALLSAHLDDELDESERRRVEAALADDDALAQELRELAATRALLRGLGPVEAPGLDDVSGVDTAPGLDTGPGPDDAPVVALDEQRRMRRPGVRVAAAAAAVAAGWFVMAAVGASIGRPSMVPDVEALSGTHMGTEDAMGFETVDVDSMDDPAVLDDVGAGMVRTAVFRDGDTVLTRYSDGSHDVSVFHEPGRVDWEGLPADGSMEEMPVGKVWKRVEDDVVIVVVERGDLVVTVVGDADMGEDMAVDASGMLPEVEIDDGVWDRLVDGPANLLDRI